MTQPEIGFTYRACDGSVTVLTFTLTEDTIEQPFQAALKFLAVIFCEQNVDDAVYSRAMEMDEVSERTEFLRRAFKPAEWTPEAAKSANDSAEMVQDAIDRMEDGEKEPSLDFEQVIYCRECGSKMEYIYPGKWQCPKCI